MVSDVSGPQMKRYIEGLQRLTPAQRLRQMGELCEAGRALALTRLRRQFPGESPAQLHRRLAIQIYGRSVIESLSKPIGPP
jgi:hypothetical protein